MKKEILFKSQYDLAMPRKGPVTSPNYFSENEFYKKFRIVFEKNKLIYNENSEYPHVFAMGFSPGKILKKIDYINEVCGTHKNIVFGGLDADPKALPGLSDLLKKHFDKIFLEAMRNEHPNIVIFPQAFNYGYTKKYNEDIFTKLINCSIDIQKEKLVGTAFGQVWPKLNSFVSDRVDLLESIKHDNLIENFYCDQSEYHYKKSKYLYFASPRGSGVQCTKMYESFMCETVPILTDSPSARQLRDYHKLPIHIIDEWGNLNEKHLVDLYKKEYKNYDWYSLKKKFHVDNFIDSFLS